MTATDATRTATDRGRVKHPGAISTLVILFAPFLLVLQASRMPGSVELAHYLPLHSFFETFAIAVAILIFAIGWHARTDETPPALLALSAGFLGVALLDFGHLLSYAGMPDFVTPSSPEKAIAFWLGARLMAALALLMAAPPCPGGRDRRRCAIR